MRWPRPTRSTRRAFRLASRATVLLQSSRALVSCCELFLRDSARCDGRARPAGSRHARLFDLSLPCRLRTPPLRSVPCLAHVRSDVLAPPGRHPVSAHSSPTPWRRARSPSRRCVCAPAWLRRGPRRKRVASTWSRRRPAVTPHRCLQLTFASAFNLESWKEMSECVSAELCPHRHSAPLSLSESRTLILRRYQARLFTA